MIVKCACSAETLEEFTDIMHTKGYKNTRVFDNVFNFMDFTCENRLTHDNSVTWLDRRKGEMHIAY